MLANPKCEFFTSFNEKFVTTMIKDMISLYCKLRRFKFNTTVLMEVTQIWVWKSVDLIEILL